MCRLEGIKILPLFDCFFIVQNWIFGQKRLFCCCVTNTHTDGTPAVFRPWGFIATCSGANGSATDATTRPLHPLCPRLGLWRPVPDQPVRLLGARIRHACWRGETGGALKTRLASAAPPVFATVVPPGAPGHASRDATVRRPRRDGFSAAAASVRASPKPPNPSHHFYLPKKPQHLLPGRRSVQIGQQRSTLPTRPPPSSNIAETDHFFN